MKAERRHDLETNELALWLRWRLPQLWEKYGTKVLLALVIGALAFVLIRQRMNAPRVALAKARQDLTDARRVLAEADPVRTPAEFGKSYELVRSAMDTSENPQIQAEGYTLLGDYHFQRAVGLSADKLGAQQMLRITEEQAKLLADAEQAYRAAADQPAGQGYLVAHAKIGLAAIEKMRAADFDRKALDAATRPVDNPHWSRVREHYQAMIDSPIVPEVLKNEARRQLFILPQLQNPVWLVKTDPATQPATQPATDPTTQPATQPAGEAVQ